MVALLAADGNGLARGRIPQDGRPGADWEGTDPAAIGPAHSLVGCSRRSLFFVLSSEADPRDCPEDGGPGRADVLKHVLRGGGR
jgi:hypothetical protein